MKRNDKTIPLRYYFVDEADDGTLFDRKGRVLVGQPVCSRYFMLGMLDVPRPAELSQALQDLRQRLLADPYFENVPSMQPAAKKTSLFFHAKDACPLWHLLHTEKAAHKSGFRWAQIKSQGYRMR